MRPKRQLSFRFSVRKFTINLLIEVISKNLKDDSILLTTETAQLKHCVVLDLSNVQLMCQNPVRHIHIYTIFFHYICKQVRPGEQINLFTESYNMFKYPKL